MKRFQPPRRASDKVITVTDARVQLTMLLVNARDISGFNVDDLARRYRVPRGEIEKRLTEERARRERLL